MLKEPVKKRRHLANEEFSWKISHALSDRCVFYRAGAWRRSILCPSRLGEWLKEKALEDFWRSFMCSVRIICYIYAEDLMAWRADGTNTEDKRCGEGHLKAGNGSGKRFG